jgi:hypothetical protein
MRNLKTPLFTVIFFLAVLSGLQAQDKYEFAVITYGWNWPNSKVTASVNGELYTAEEVKEKDKKGLYDLNPVIKKVNEFVAQGWEVFSTGGGDNLIHYYLRKRKS